MKFILLFISISSFSQPTRVKNIITIKGVRSNPLIGYGLVVGLNGSGDSGGEVTNNSLKRMFKKLGLDAKEEIESKNVAAVIVTANLPPFSRSGSKIDVHVSSIGNAKSLKGGNLLVTPLKGGDGQIYSVASGNIIIGDTKDISKIETSGRIPDGGLVEKEIEINFDKKKYLRFSLNEADFTTAYRLQKIINNNLGGKFANAKDSNTIDLIIPHQYRNRVVELIALVENMNIIPDQKAIITINERTGTVVAGKEVSIGEISLTHGNISIEIKGDEDNSNTENKNFHIKETTNLGELVNILNKLGISQKDLISIIQALKKNNSLIGEVRII